MSGGPGGNLGNRYQEMDIRTASPETLIVRLYERALRELRAARGHQEAGRVAVSGHGHRVRGKRDDG